MQKIILQGNVGKEVKTVNFGDRTQLSFSLACTNRDKDKTTTWYNVLSPDVRLQQYITSGKPLLVTGDLSVKTSQGKDGKTYVNVNVNNASIDFLPTPKQDNAPQRTTVAPQPSMPQPQQNTTMYSGNDELPF